MYYHRLAMKYIGELVSLHKVIEEMTRQFEIMQMYYEQLLQTEPESVSQLAMVRSNINSQARQIRKMEDFYYNEKALDNSTIRRYLDAMVAAQFGHECTSRDDVMEVVWLRDNFNFPGPIVIRIDPMEVVGGSDGVQAGESGGVREIASSSGQVHNVGSRRRRRQEGGGVQDFSRGSGGSQEGGGVQDIGGGSGGSKEGGGIGGVQDIGGGSGGSQEGGGCGGVQDIASGSGGSQEGSGSGGLIQESGAGSDSGAWRDEVRRAADEYHIPVIHRDCSPMEVEDDLSMAKRQRKKVTKAMHQNRPDK